MENNQPLFDIFEFLGIEITDNLERVQKAIDDLPAAKMAELRKKPEFSSMRKFLYTKKASNEFLSYVQDIRDVKDPAKQEKLRQEQLRQQQEQLQQQELQRQEQLRQQQERQRQEQIRQQQERQRQEQLRQQQERQRQQQERQRQERLRQQQYQQQYRQPQQQYQQPYYQPQYRSQPQYQNTQQSAPRQTKVRNSNHQTNPAAAILAFIGAVLYGIWWALKNAFISICAFFGFGDAPATIQLATPTITSITEHDDYVVVAWGPVFCADYYELHDEEIDYDIKIESGLTKTITRPDYGTKEYTLTAHSNKSKYTTSDRARITVRPKYLGSPPDDNYFYY